MIPEDLAKELRALNENLRESQQAMLRLTGNLKDLAGHTKAVWALCKQINILNQILLQVGKKSGTAAMLSNLMEAVATLAKHAR